MRLDQLVTQLLTAPVRVRKQLVAEHRRHVRAGTHPVQVTSRLLEPLCGRPVRAARWVHMTTITVRLP